MDNMDESGVMSTQDRLIYMANQIARNISGDNPDETADRVAEHIRQFWDPSMRRHIVALAKEHPEKFAPVTTAAITQIASR